MRLAEVKLTDWTMYCRQFEKGLEGSVPLEKAVFMERVGFESNIGQMSYQMPDLLLIAFYSESEDSTVVRMLHVS